MYQKLLSFLFIFFFSNAALAEVQINAPQNVNAGADVKVEFSGESTPKDFITIVPADTAEGKWDTYKYTHKANSAVVLTAPELGGSYEIRMMEGTSYKTLATQKLEVTEVTASLQAPAETVAGANIQIDWSGPDNNNDFITVVKADAPEGQYASYKYVKRKFGPRKLNKVELQAPEEPGDYEIRYLSGNKRLTLASSPIKITQTEASLTASQQVKAGEKFEVDWTGPDNNQDFITIVKANDEEGKYGPYKYVNRKYGPRKLNKVELTAPDEPGDYEVRYLTGQKRFTLASAPVKVVSTEASVATADQVMEGAKFEVDWTGPDNAQDFITIVKVGSEEGAYTNYKYTGQKFGPRKLNKVELKAPEESGEYEVRYLTGQKRLTLASVPIKVVPVTASLDAPETAIAKDTVQVSWEGPGNDGDYIAIRRPDSENTTGQRYAYTRRGKTLKINTPDLEGAYEVQYVTAGKRILATRPIQIEASKVPGKISVVASSETLKSKSIGGDISVSLILDASGSMLKRDLGERRIEIAKKAVAKFIEGPLSNGAQFAMRVFGHREADSCRTDLEIPLGPVDQPRALRYVRSLQAMNYAKTPIAKSLELVEKDLESAEGTRIVILVTDGEETCDGDPKAAIEKLAKSGFNTRVNIVGLAIDEFMLKETFREWAQLGNGKYFDAQNAEELEKSIVEAVEVPYEVLSLDNQLIATGVVNGDPLSVLPGDYTVKILTSPEKTFNQVAVSAEKLNTLRVEDLG